MEPWETPEALLIRHFNVDFSVENIYYYYYYYCMLGLLQITTNYILYNCILTEQ